MGLNSSRGEPGGSAQVKGSLQITVCVRSPLAHDHPLEDLSWMLSAWLTLPVLRTHKMRILATLR